jgi:hypothetical protein
MQIYRRWAPSVRRLVLNLAVLLPLIQPGFAGADNYRVTTEGQCQAIAESSASSGDPERANTIFASELHHEAQTCSQSEREDRERDFLELANRILVNREYEWIGEDDLVKEILLLDEILKNKDQIHEMEKLSSLRFDPEIGKDNLEANEAIREIIENHQAMDQASRLYRAKTDNRNKGQEIDPKGRVYRHIKQTFMGVGIVTPLYWLLDWATQEIIGGVQPILPTAKVPDAPPIQIKLENLLPGNQKHLNRLIAVFGTTKLILGASTLASVFLSFGTFTIPLAALSACFYLADSTCQKIIKDRSSKVRAVRYTIVKELTHAHSEMAQRISQVKHPSRHLGEDIVPNATSNGILQGINQLPSTAFVTVLSTFIGITEIFEGLYDWVHSIKGFEHGHEFLKVEEIFFRSLFKANVRAKQRQIDRALRMGVDLKQRYDADPLALSPDEVSKTFTPLCQARAWLDRLNQKAEDRFGDRIHYIETKIRNRNQWKSFKTWFSRPGGILEKTKLKNKIARNTRLRLELEQAQRTLYEEYGNLLEVYRLFSSGTDQEKYYAELRDEYEVCRIFVPDSNAKFDLEAESPVPPTKLGREEMRQKSQRCQEDLMDTADRFEATLAKYEALKLALMKIFPEDLKTTFETLETPIQRKDKNLLWRWLTLDRLKSFTENLNEDSINAVQTGHLFMMQKQQLAETEIKMIDLEKRIRGFSGSKVEVMELENLLDQHRIQKLILERKLEKTNPDAKL